MRNFLATRKGKTFTKLRCWVKTTVALKGEDSRDFFKGGTNFQNLERSGSQANCIRPSHVGSLQWHVTAATLLPAPV